MDLTFKTPQGKFNYRVGAVIIHKGQILVVRNTDSSYYYSVGGRVKYNETTEEAVRREVQEELGVELDIDRPVFMHETFFDEKDTREHFHEVSLFYLMKDNEKLDKINCASFTENGKKESLVWLPLEEIERQTVFPTFFATELKELPSGLKLIIDVRER